MPYHKTGAYDGFDSIAEAKQHYRRCRTDKHFILSDQGVATDKPKCAECGELVEVDPADSDKKNNRCMFHRKTKLCSVMHYDCSWKNILNHIFCRENLI
jgi:hypothetical protein